jgi:DNA polymerase elongation subunit (family B)
MARPKDFKTYPKRVREFIKVRMEQTPNNTQIARDVKNKFQNHYEKMELDILRRRISKFREEEKVVARNTPIRRLFFDIETGYYIVKQRVWSLKNQPKYISPDCIEKEKEVLCISYKWQGEDEVYTLDYRIGEKNMLKKFIKILGEADEIIGHNGDNFDIKFLRARCIYHGVLMFPNYRTLDTLKKSRGGFLFASNKLDYLGKYFGVGGKASHRGMGMWVDIVEHGSDEAMEEMIQYCERDVIMLEDIFFIMSPFITHNNNFSILHGGEKWDCPECTSKNVEMHHCYATPMGIVRREMKCNDCKKQYKISNKNYMGFLEHLMK